MAGPPERQGEHGAQGGGEDQEGGRGHGHQGQGGGQQEGSGIVKPSKSQLFYYYTQFYFLSNVIKSHNIQTLLIYKSANIIINLWCRNRIPVLMHWNLLFFVLTHCCRGSEYV